MDEVEAVIVSSVHLSLRLLAARKLGAALKVCGELAQRNSDNQVAQTRNHQGSGPHGGGQALTAELRQLVLRDGHAQQVHEGGVLGQQDNLVGQRGRTTRNA